MTKLKPWRIPSRRLWCVALVSFLTLAGCASSRDHDSGGLRRPLAMPQGGWLMPRDLAPEPDDGRPAAVLLAPPSAAPGDLVILAHGFARAPERHAALARALAARGLRVALPRLPPARPWSGGQWRHAMALIRLADALEAERRVYVGFSAGALAALIAARNDPRAVALVTLDAVDAEGLGARLAPALGVPLLALWGAPSPCNAAQGARAGLARAPQVAMESFARASHCDFESPTDWRCRLLCEGGARAQGASRAALTARVVDWIEARLERP